MNSMVKYLGFALLLVGAGCTGDYYSDAYIAESNEPFQPASDPVNGDTVMLDHPHSEIAWKGTKLWGRGMHTGIVPIQKGYLLKDGSRLTGGFIQADMTDIGITDIPPDQPEPIRILTGHLEDEVFFSVEDYPTASFRFTDITYIRSDSLMVSGNLTIRGVTNGITIPALSTESKSWYTSRFRINRFDWGIAYRGGFGKSKFAARNFVDKYIELTITLAGRESGLSTNAD